ncbi:MAG: YkgJ family cysteine cluster protein [Nanoarchaeota archaeon]
MRPIIDKTSRFFRSFFPSSFKFDYDCSKCDGRCCRLEGLKCPLFDMEANRCRIYLIRPLQCRKFPQSFSDAQSAGCPAAKVRSRR